MSHVTPDAQGAVLVRTGDAETIREPGRVLRPA
jgi:hypothetical protein